MSKQIQVFRYILFDFLGSAAAWVVFNLYRKKFIESQLFGGDIPFSLDTKFLLGIIIFPVFWVALFGLAGFYHNVYRKSRLKELSASIGYTLLGSLLIFFAMLLDDYIVSYRSYYRILLSLYVLVFALTYIPRLLLTMRTIHRIHSRKIGFPSIIVGNGEMALNLYSELKSEPKSQGYLLVGYIIAGADNRDLMSGKLPCLGELEGIASVVRQRRVEEVLLAIDGESSEMLTQIINELLSLNVLIKAIPSMYDYLAGRVKMTGIFNAPLLNISFELMPPWQLNLKRTMDYSVGVLAMCLLLPLMVVLAIVIKITSRGSVFYRQERVGQFGKPFTLLKFRSMYTDAEANGPALSSKTDARVTPVGRFMRKTRLDELPNFINVIKGEMSLVGPRPERQFFIDQIIKIAPHYVHLQKVKPGITSWGQVKYGYAENVTQMVERLKYDLLYIENMSLFVDFKIIIYTLITVVRGRGV